jgi:tripartite-type tricarboxylate transporter receptor subunit TctC
MNWRIVPALVCGLALASPPAHAAEYPSRPIKLIVPYAAGGPTDVLGRMVADYLGRDLKQTVVVENKAGAQGAIGAEAAARSEPDGYTLFFTAASLFVLNPLLYKKLPYDPDRDFRMLQVITDIPMIMEVHPSVPAKTVAEFVAYAKANPGKLNFGSAGTGGTIHLAGEMFKQMAGVFMVHIPYSGGNPAQLALLSGQVDLTFDNLATAAANIRAGKLRAIAVTTAKRASAMPEIPTIAESGRGVGLGSFDIDTWFGVFGPARLPADVTQRLYRAFADALASPDIRSRLATFMAEPAPLAPEAFAAFVKAELAKYERIVKATGARVE